MLRAPIQAKSSGTTGRRAVKRRQRQSPSKVVFGSWRLLPLREPAPRAWPHPVLWNATMEAGQSEAAGPSKTQSQEPTRGAVPQRNGAAARMLRWLLRSAVSSPLCCTQAGTRAQLPSCSLDSLSALLFALGDKAGEAIEFLGGNLPTFSP